MRSGREGEGSEAGAPQAHPPSPFPAGEQPFRGFAVATEGKWGCQQKLTTPL